MVADRPAPAVGSAAGPSASERAELTAAVRAATALAVPARDRLLETVRLVRAWLGADGGPSPAGEGEDGWAGLLELELPPPAADRVVVPVSLRDAVS